MVQMLKANSQKEESYSRMALVLLLTLACGVNAVAIDLNAANDQFVLRDLKLRLERKDEDNSTWYSTVINNKLEVLANDVKINLDEASCLIPQSNKQAENSKKVYFVDKAMDAGFTHVYRTHIAARPWCLFDFVVPSVNSSGRVATLAGEFCIGEHVAGGAAVGDYDNDGWEDIFFAVFHGRSRLYRNKGDGTFTDVTEESEIGPDKYANGAVWFDIDQDGDLDLYVTSLGNSQHFLYVNYGGHFKEEAMKRGVSMQFPNKRKLAGMTPSVGDCDNDGYPDLYVTEWILHSQGKPSASRLMRNLGAQKPGYFEDVTIKANVLMDSYWREYALNAGTFTFGASFTDFDNDGFAELLVTGDYGESKMFWNNGNGTFTMCTRQCGLVGDVDAMGHAIGDLNNDGYLEWFSSAIYDNATNCEVTGCMFGSKGNKLFKNLGNRKFQEISTETGVHDGGWAWGSAFFDCDNDGYLDIVHTNGIDFPSTTVDDVFQKQYMRLFRNLGKAGNGEKMEEIAVSAGMTFHGQGRGLLKFDYDEDGDEDVVVVANVGHPVFYENKGGDKANWLRVMVTNRCMNNVNRLCESLGARVTVTDPSGHKQMQEIGSSTHYLGQSERTAHFGLGFYSSGVTLKVYWPVQKISLTVTGVMSRQRIKVIRPDRNMVITYQELAKCHTVELAEIMTEGSILNPRITADKKAIQIDYVPFMSMNKIDRFSYHVKVSPTPPPKYNVTSIATVAVNMIHDVSSIPVCQNGRMVLPNTPPVIKTEKRLLNGMSNNQVNLLWGTAGTDLRRGVPPAYVDNVSLPASACSLSQRETKKCPYPKEMSGAGSHRPSPRMISNELFAQANSIFSSRGLSDLHSHFGQFVSHDLDFSSPLARFEFQGMLNEVWMPIKVPMGDSQFDPAMKDTAFLPFTRSTYNRCTGIYPNGLPRQQVNKITSYIDASQVYGVSEMRNRELRTLQDGKLKLSDDGIIPSNDRGVANDNPVGRDPRRLKMAGDTRANVQPVLIVLHSIFAREHNRLCEEYKKKNPQAGDEEIFQYARKIVIAEMQAIIFREFIPSTLGSMDRVPKYNGYNPLVNPSVSNIFATAAFRYGHSQVNEKIFRLQPDGNMSEYGHMLLREGYFNPERVELEGGLDPVIRGTLAFPAQEVDLKMVDEMRNALFPVGRDNGLDLAAMNIQRGRDHGLPDYNSVRQMLGLPALVSFDQITKNKEIADKLQMLYKDINNVDLWVGGLAEDHVSGSELGPTFEKIFIDTFVRVRDGDRFWYEFYLSKEEIAMVNDLTLSKIIRMNSGVKTAQDNVFFASGSCRGVMDFQCQAKQTEESKWQEEQRKLMEDRLELQGALNNASSELMNLKYKYKYAISKQSHDSYESMKYATVILGALFGVAFIMVVLLMFLLRDRFTHMIHRDTKQDGTQRNFDQKPNKNAVGSKC